MPKITIREADSNALPSTISQTDVVYVPGFGTITAGKFDPNTIVEPFVPTLCNTVEEFEAYFGTAPATFTASQSYSGFSTNATPTGIAMFSSGDEDPSYIYAKELLNLGIPVLYERINDSTTAPTVAAMYAAMSGSGQNDIYQNLKDIGEYNVKFITSGGYPTFEYSGDDEDGGNIICAKMIDTASTRTDCVALIDHTNNADRVLVATNNTSVYYAATNSNSSYKITTDGYAAMFTPWINVNCPTNGSAETMPASFGYLTALGAMIKTYPNYLAVAGTKRGVIPNFISLATNKILTNAIAESYQADNGISINPITNIKPYGFCIWGTRTLKDNSVSGGLTAFSYLNLRNLASDIKKLAYEVVKKHTFEQNTDILKLNIKSELSPTLDSMMAGNGIRKYNIIFTVPAHNQLNVTIKVEPIEPVENFDIALQMTDGNVAIA